MLPRVLAGSGEQDAAFDPQTRTVYVANSYDNTLSVINAAICNARDTAGCGQTAPTVAAGNGDSLDSAVELAKGCPVLETGGAVDVYEAIAM